MKEQQDALEILEQLKGELGTGHGFFSKKPDWDLCADLCDELSRILPEYVKDAAYVKNRSKEILGNADVVAKTPYARPRSKPTSLFRNRK